MRQLLPGFVTTERQPAARGGRGIEKTFDGRRRARMSNIAELKSRPTGCQECGRRRGWGVQATCVLGNTATKERKHNAITQRQLRSTVWMCLPELTKMSVRPPFLLPLLLSRPSTHRASLSRFHSPVRSSLALPATHSLLADVSKGASIVWPPAHTL